MDSNIYRKTIQDYLDCEALTSPFQVTQADKNKDFTDIILDPTAAFLGPNLWTDSKQDCIGLDLFESNPGRGQEIQEIILDANINAACDTSNVYLSELNSTCQRQSQALSVYAESLKDFSDIDKSSGTFSAGWEFCRSDLALSTPPGHKHYDPASTILSEDNVKPHSVIKRSRKNYIPGNLKDDKYWAKQQRNNPPGHKHYDLSTTFFSGDKLKPHSIIKKSRKNYVPDNLKDDKYWDKRQKNNISAQRSREARRLRDNEIAHRALFLEEENISLKENVKRLKAENVMLKNMLQKYQS